MLKLLIPFLLTLNYAPMDPAENDAYENALSEALAYEKAKIIDYEERHPDQSVGDLELLKLKTNYDIKFNLAKKYIRTTPLRSKEVRDKLIALIKKPKVVPADLMKFQALIEKEKEKIRAHEQIE